MAKVICKKCRVTGISKCPYCRSVFPDCQYDAMLSHVLKYQYNKEQHRTEITYYWYDSTEEGENKNNTVQALKSLYGALRAMSEGVDGMTFESYACNHSWVFAEGQHSEINCGH